MDQLRKWDDELENSQQNDRLSVSLMLSSKKLLENKHRRQRSGHPLKNKKRRERRLLLEKQPIKEDIQSAETF